MRVLVTGAFGYLGSALLARLAGRFALVATGHSPRRPVPVPAGVETAHCDVDDLPALVAGQHFDAVVHLAGGGGPAKIAADPVRAVRVDVAATARLAAAMRDVPRRLLASTIAVYGTHRTSDRPYRESDPALADDLYGALKAAAEAVWCDVAGGTALRIANVYGAGCGVDLGLEGVAERFARAAATGGQLTMYGEGEQRLDLVHVDDVVDGIAAALVAPSLPPAINLGGGAPVSIAELAAHAARAGRQPIIGKKPPPPGKIWPDRSLAIELAAERLGWRPAVPIDRGMAELVAMMSPPE